MAMCEHYLYISSNDSNHIYPNNNASDFWIEFPHAISLLGVWEIAVIEMNFSSPNTDDFYLLCDACEVSYINNSYRPVLRNIHSNTSHIIFNHPVYVKVSRDKLERLHFYILRESGLSSSFSSETLKCTLHLRKIK